MSSCINYEGTAETLCWCQTQWIYGWLWKLLKLGWYEVFIRKTLLLHHNKVSFDYHICQHKNNSKDALNCHIKKEHKGLRRYECHECDGLCTGKQGVRRHVESVHTGLKFDCDMCELMIELNSGWRCMQCGKGSKNKTLLKMHFKSEHMGITHTCEMCGHKYKIKNTFHWWCL